ncbi:hypothetical protein [Pelagibaculum spongiae]|uniref:Uncharacterized protein n=1 Tax=Pelagibaculum spongiae TaxID=2080658 RepID=A0A2V1GWZ5_9GAMM|nr:hypothetical protein [Pelagibaculum spongiae]PVZ65655.1 hypothetical protein DC094_17365 [Pelagibaculum spongiae]
MVNSDEVFSAVRRGYNDLEFSSNSDIVDYFDSIEEKSIGGHISNIKGILFEQEYVDQLATQGIEAQIFEATNHPVTDISIFDGDEVISEMQLKATDSASYINATLNDHPDVEIVTTTEVAQGLDSEMVIDSGISNDELNDSVANALFGTDDALSSSGDSIVEEIGAEALLGESLIPISPASLLIKGCLVSFGFIF